MDRVSLGPYCLSLPERVVRSATVLTAGLARELGNITLPAAVRRTAIYQTMVDSTLHFLIEEVGQVKGEYPAASRLADDFLARKVLGQGIESVGRLVFRTSPLWAMALLADLSGTGRHLLREISETLKREGLLAADASIETVDQMLAGLEKSADQLANALNAPPLRVEELRAEWEMLRRNAADVPKLPSSTVVQKAWDDLKVEAAVQNRTVYQLATMMSVASFSQARQNLPWIKKATRVGARRTKELFLQTWHEHYTETMASLRAEGVAAWWTREFSPYLRAAAGQFSPQRVSFTQRLIKSRAWRLPAGPS